MKKKFAGDDLVPEYTKDGEIIITEEVFKIACPELYEEILEHGRRLERERVRMPIPKLPIPSTVPGPAGEDKETKKKRLIKEYKEGHPGVSLKDVVLAVGKAHPELFR